jgi:hypothetical protein
MHYEEIRKDAINGRLQFIYQGKITGSCPSTYPVHVNDVDDWVIVTASADPYTREEIIPLYPNKVVTVAGSPFTGDKYDLCAAIQPMLDNVSAGAGAGASMANLENALISKPRHTPDGVVPTGSYTKNSLLTAINYLGTYTKYNSIQVLASDSNDFSLTCATDGSVTTTENGQSISGFNPNDEIEDFTLVVAAGKTVTVNLVLFQ